MKVVFIVRSNLFTARGGDTVQIQETADQLSRQMAVTVDIKFSYEKIEYDAYDLLHFFNIIRPADILAHIRQTKKPFVVSTIFVDYSEYDKGHRKGFSGGIFKFFSPDTIEYLKTIARVVKGKDKLTSWEYLWKGQETAIKTIAQKAACLLPNSANEYNRFVSRYKINAKYAVIPNGVGDLFLNQIAGHHKDPMMILCVARIEGIKNQLNLIKALRHTDFKLYVIGSCAPNQKKYYEECRKAAGDNTVFIDHLSQPDLLDYYRKAKVHILPSWFETTGLSSLEAAIMGCNVIITDRGDAKEYFKDHAIYCDPGSLPSIQEAVVKASIAEINNELREIIQKNYTWKNAARETYQCYKEILGSN